MNEAAETTVGFRTRAFEVRVDSVTGVLLLIDLKTGRRWEGDPWLNTAGMLSISHPAQGQCDFPLSQARHVSVASEGDRAIGVTFAGFMTPKNQPVEAVVRTRIGVAVESEGSVRAEVLAVELPNEWALVELEYPCRLGALRTDVDAGYMVVPYLQGCMVPSTVRNWKEIPKLHPWSWDDGPWMEPGGADIRIAGWTSLSLPMFGFVDGDSAYVAIVETENDASLRLVLNSNYQHVYSRRGELSPWQRLAATSPLWLAERDQLGYRRSVLYVALPGGDYVSMAKRYRQFAREQGLLVTLREKIDRTPHLEKMIGALWINMEGGYPYYIDHPPYRYTWKDAKKLVDDLLQYVGLERALLTLWIGYQHLPPDNYPFHPAQGPIEDLQDLVQYALGRDVLINFYHGWPALLDDAPNGDIARARRNRSGAMGQRWGRHCPTFFPKYARKNLPSIIKDSGIVCEYSDILTAGSLNECWDERHPLTRTQDRKLREETMEFVNSLGLFSGSEWPVPYAMPYLTYFRNGGAGAGGHLVLSQFPLPLMNLVFKDCALMYGQYFPVADSAMIRDLSAGSHLQATYCSLKDYYREGYYKTREGVKASVAVFQDWLRQTGLEELVSHSFVDEWNGPYTTRFADGSESLVNLTQDRREVGGVVLEPESMALRFSNGRLMKAKPRQGWDLLDSRD